MVAGLAITPDDVLTFWFSETRPKQWFQVDIEFDQTIWQRFGRLHEMAAAGELFAWRRSCQGRLAEILVLDQFSRNIFRGSRSAFAQDAAAVVLAQHAIEAGALDKIEPVQCAFLLMPLMHSESKKIHEIAVPLFKQFAPETNYKFELEHKAIIDRFSRYPHRNQILGRESTAEELEFLKQPGSGF